MFPTESSHCDSVTYSQIFIGILTNYPTSKNSVISFNDIISHPILEINIHKHRKPTKSLLFKSDLIPFILKDTVKTYW